MAGKNVLGGALDVMEAAAKSGKILRSDYESFAKTYDPIENNVDQAMQSLRENAKRKKYLAANSAMKFDELAGRMDEMGNGSEFLANLISPSWRANSSETNLQMLAEALEGKWRAGTGDMDEALSTRLTSLLRFDKKAQDQFVFAVLDPTAPGVDPRFAKMAAEASNMLDEALDGFNKAGGDMRRIEGEKGKFLPQTHDTMRMQRLDKHQRAKPDQDLPTKERKEAMAEYDYKAARDKWIAFAAPRLDYKRMGMDKNSGEKNTEILHDIYDTIISNGKNKKGDDPEYAGFSVDPMTANTRQDHREVHFADAKSWIEYKDMYGNPDIYKTMMDYVTGMSRDTAAMKIFGANPQNNFNKLLDKARQEDKLKMDTGHLEGMFDIALGKADATESANNYHKALATTGGGFRALGVATDLGSAVISSVTDLATSQMAAQMAGMGNFKLLYSQVGTIMRRVFAGMKVSEKEKFLARIGVASDQFTSSIRNNRFSEGGGGQGIQKVAEFTIRSSGLGAWTSALRNTFTLELNGMIADNIGKSLDSFEYGKQLKAIHGLTDADWQKITTDHTTDFESGGYFDMTKLYESEPELSLKLAAIIKGETNFAIIMPDARIRSITTGFGAKKGTLGGEVVRTTMMYKSFPIAMLSMIIGRMVGIEGAVGKLKYASGMAVGTTMMGTLALEMKDLLKGREPRDPTDWRTWAAGSMQGGGMGIVGDFFFSSQSRYGGDYASTFLLGKAAQPINDLGAIKEVLLDQSEDKNAAGKLAERALNYVPGRNLWYTRLAFDRFVGDWIKKTANPNYDAKVRRHLQKLKEETGQGYWSKPGSFQK